MLRRQRSAPGSAPGSGISLYDRRSCRAVSHGSRAQPSCPWRHSGHGGTLASLWVKPLQCSFIPWVLWPGRRQQKLQEFRPGRRVPAPGGGSQVALWKRRSGHRWGQSQSWHSAALSRGEASHLGSACTPLCPAGRGCCQCPPSQAQQSPSAACSRKNWTWEQLGVPWRASLPQRVIGVTPPCPRGTPVPTAVTEPVQQQC